MDRTATLVGVIKAHGPLGKKTQRSVRLHCERGNIRHVVSALGEALLDIGMAEGVIPHNTGVRTPELFERMQNCVSRVVSNYHDGGGVILAKGYTTHQILIDEITAQWVQGFSKPIPRTYSLSKHEEETLARVSVVALKARQILVEYLEGEEIKIPVAKLEAVCKTLSTELYRAFENPNEANHEVVHAVCRDELG